MIDHSPKPASPWDEYREIRDRYYAAIAPCFGWMFALFLSGALLIRSLNGAAWLFPVAIPAVAWTGWKAGVAMLRYNRLTFRLWFWTCPVCYKCFALSTFSVFPGDCCRHCGTALGSPLPDRTKSASRGTALDRSKWFGGP